MSDRKKTSSVESVYAMWHDPSTYDPMRMGPPYLPGQVVRTPGLPKQASEAIGPEIRELLAAEKKTADEELTTLLGHFVGDYEAMPMAELAALLAFLRALNSVHLTHHWQTKGRSFYGDHKLFEDIYNETIPMIDALAERTVGAGSPILVNPVIQAAHSAALVKSLYNGAPVNPGPDDLVLLSLKGVLRFSLLLRMVYDALESKGLLSHGTDNLLQGFADQHEVFAYLLKQRSTVRVSYARTRSWKAV